MLEVAVIVSPGTETHLIATPHAVFRAASRDHQRYRVTWCAERPGTLETADGLTITVEHGLEATRAADVVVVPSWSLAREPSGVVTDALVDAHARGATVVGLCLGAFPVAASGVLGGRAAATHWAYADELRRRHGVAVDHESLWVDHGDVVTSAGSTAGLDCCLHLVRRHYGADVAAQAASRLVLAPHREGNQAQHAWPSAAPRTPASAITRAMEHALASLDAPRTLDTLRTLDAWAAAVGMSRRTLSRAFRAEVGVSPHQWLIARRLDVARRLLERDDATVDAVARDSGFADASSLRTHFRERFGTTPAAYRRSHRAREARVASEASPEGRKVARAAP